MKMSEKLKLMSPEERKVELDAYFKRREEYRSALIRARAATSNVRAAKQRQLKGLK